MAETVSEDFLPQSRTNGKTDGPTVDLGIDGVNPVTPNNPLPKALPREFRKDRIVYEAPEAPEGAEFPLDELTTEQRIEAGDPPYEGPQTVDPARVPGPDNEVPYAKPGQSNVSRVGGTPEVREAHAEELKTEGEAEIHNDGRTETERKGAEADTRKPVEDMSNEELRAELTHLGKETGGNGPQLKKRLTEARKENSTE
jgi:hypothetical protein